MVKEKGGDGFSIYVQVVGRLKAETLDGDRENWLPGCISDIRSENTALGRIRSRRKALKVLSLFQWTLKHAFGVKQMTHCVQKFGDLNEFYLVWVLYFSSSQDKSNNTLFADKMCSVQSSANVLQILVTCVYSSIL